MSMMIADIQNGTVLPKTEIFAIDTRTSGDPRQVIPTNIGDTLFFSITKTDSKGIQTIGTYAKWQNTVASNNEGIGINFVSFSQGTINVYFGTGGNDGTNLFYSYSIPMYGTSGTGFHRLVCFPYGGTFNEDDTWDFGTVQGSFAGSMRIYINQPFPQESSLLKVEYTNPYSLPQPSSYTASFQSIKVKHRLDSQKMVVYNKGNIYNGNIGFEQVTEEEKDDLMDIYNTRANLRFFPNIEGNGTNYFDVIWDNDFDFQFTTPSFTGGGYSGNINLVGLENIGTARDIF